MSITHEDVKKALDEMQLKCETDGKNFLHATAGRYAELISTVITLDEDSGGLTIVSTLPIKIKTEHRPAVYELMNLVHGQNIWNFRLHLDEEGRLLALGKMKSWGRAFDAVQFGDIFFSVLVTTDRFSRSLSAIAEQGLSGTKAFESFFTQKPGKS